MLHNFVPNSRWDSVCFVIAISVLLGQCFLFKTTTGIQICLDISANIGG
jgi:hypothetical protein